MTFRSRQQALIEAQRALSQPEYLPPGSQIPGRIPPRILTNPGKLVRLERGRSDTVSIEMDDPLVNEFGVFISVEPETMSLLSVVGPVFGVQAHIEASFDSANFFYYRPSSVYIDTDVPLCGIAIPVHGQRISVSLRRSNAEAAIGTAVLVVAIIPRLPAPAPDTRYGEVVQDVSGFIQEIPMMARTFKILTDVAAGDFIEFRNPARNPIGSFMMSSEMILRPIPIPREAIEVRYHTVSVAPKNIIIDFETWF